MLSAMPTTPLVIWVLTLFLGRSCEEAQHIKVSDIKLVWLIDISQTLLENIHHLGVHIFVRCAHT